MLGAKVIADDSCRLTVVRSLENTYFYFYFYFYFPWCIVFCANTLTLPILQVVGTVCCWHCSIVSFRHYFATIYYLLHCFCCFFPPPFLLFFWVKQQQHIELFILYRVCQSCCCRVPPNLVRLDYFGVRCV